MAAVPSRASARSSVASGPRCLKPSAGPQACRTAGRWPTACRSICGPICAAVASFAMTPGGSSWSCAAPGTSPSSAVRTLTPVVTPGCLANHQLICRWPTHRNGCWRHCTSRTTSRPRLSTSQAPKRTCHAPWTCWRTSGRARITTAGYPSAWRSIRWIQAC